MDRAIQGEPGPVADATRGIKRIVSQVVLEVAVRCPVGVRRGSGLSLQHADPSKLCSERHPVLAAFVRLFFHVPRERAPRSFLYGSASFRRQASWQHNVVEQPQRAYILRSSLSAWVSSFFGPGILAGIKRLESHVRLTDLN